MPDTAIPVFQRVDERGQATLTVEAFIEALGIILHEKGTNETFNTIRWIDALQRTTELIVGNGNEIPGEHFLSMQAGRAGHALSNLSLKTDDSEEGLSWQETGVVANTVSPVHGSTQAKIIDAASRSSFLQLALESSLGEKWRINFGTSLLTFASSSLSNLLTISHGLGASPVCTLAMVNEPPTSGMITWSGQRNATSFALASSSPIALAGTVQVSWVAIG